ncbi:unnamed protein product [Brachionus calyciflorus]|uniref:MULE transposase domain-containing protein n=1 Tax=Brachionus calyciflorus TaxID=104777 RepID=A0A814CHF5_9BILA|nr:unnamed protein product [Brachionus calyciflorus]
MCDFEVALMKSVSSVFPDVNLKGCWFHFSLVIKKHIFSLGFKHKYLNEWKFKFWLKRFMTLALIKIFIVIEIVAEIWGSLIKIFTFYDISTIDMINCIKKEDAKTRNSFLATRKTKKQAKKEVEKDFQIQLIQEEFRINAVDFKTYFENLTRQVMNPYEDDIEEDDNIQFNLDGEDFVILLLMRAQK